MKKFPAGAPRASKKTRPAKSRRVLHRVTRGRPKDPRINEDVVLAVLNLLKTKGYHHVTIERVARTVKRPRTSLYSRWPSKRQLVAYAALSTLGAQPAADTGSLRGDLISAVDTLRRAFSGPLGQAIPGLLADMAHDPALAKTIREEVLMRRRGSIQSAISRGIARGELGKNVQIDVLMDLLTAPCYFRLLFRHGRITRSFVETVVDYVLCAGQ